MKKLAVTISTISVTMSSMDRLCSKVIKEGITDGKQISLYAEIVELEILNKNKSVNYKTEGNQNGNTSDRWREWPGYGFLLDI